MKQIFLPFLSCKKIAILLLTVFIGLHSSAQTITNYNFASSASTFTPLSSPNIITWNNTDDDVSDLIPIGFDFWYMGIRYTNLSASTNGWLTLGAVASDAVYTNNLIQGGTSRPIIAPLWDDLDLGSSSNASYLTTGTAGNRIFTLQYIHVKWNYLSPGNVSSFQVKLYESTGVIRFIYRADLTAPNNPSASIGITAIATGAGNFLSVNNAGTGVSSTIEANVTTPPASGTTYSFTPSVPATPGSLTFSGVSNTAMTLGWADLSVNETGFAIYRSTDGINYSFISQTTANATSSVQTGLTANITYYWKVYAVTEGALSAALSGSRITVCAPPAAPVVISPVAYCLNATALQLSATGTNLLWGGSLVSGSAGGTSVLTTSAYIDASYSNKKTNFTTIIPNLQITTADYYIPPYQVAMGLVLAIYNSAGTAIAISPTSTSQVGTASSIKITNTFNYTIVTPGNYSIGVYSGYGNIGSDNPAFPITEATGSINVTGAAGGRFFNNIRFTSGSSSAVAPIPSTTIVGASGYSVTQTVNGCTSLPATITVNVSSLSISQIPAAGLISNYTFSGNANDATGNNNGVLQNAPALTTDRFNIANKAYAFNGSTQYISTTVAYVNPTDFSISIWFKTASATGGKLIGFGNSQTGTSGQFDRHIYMNNAGQLYFGIYSGGVFTTNSTLSYNDNNWHLATATVSAAAGMTLYVDGAQVGTNAAGVAGETFTGYWRIGFDNNSGWTSQPSNFYFSGSLDDAQIYSRAISAAEVTKLFLSPDGAGNNGPACVGSSIGLTAATLSGATYAWTGPNGYTSSLQNPSFTYSLASAGTYKLQVTASGCIATAYTNVISSVNAGQWAGTINADWSNAGNWCAGIAPTSATNVTIPASAVNMPAISDNVFCNNLTINTGASLSISAGGTLNISGTLVNSGTVTNNGTTNFNGTTGQQTFSGVSSFYNLTVNNSSGLLLPSAITIRNNLLITAGSLNSNNFNINIKGNWTNNVSTTGFSAGTTTVTFTGSAAQSIGGTSSTIFTNLSIADTINTVTLNVNTIVNGNLTISNGTLDMTGFTINGTGAGGTLTVSNGATLKIGGTNTFPVNYNIITLVVASTVIYSGTDQTIANLPYGNLILSSSGGAAVKTFPAGPLTILGNFSSTPGSGTSVSFTAASAITIGGNVSIGAATTFNGGSYSHNIGGNWTNNGTFNGNTGTIIFTGAGTTVNGSGAQNFNNLTVAAAQVVFSSNSITLTGNLATTGTGSFTHAAGGSLFMTGSGTTISGPAISLENLVISGSVSITSSLTLTGNLSVSGTLTASAATITMSGALKTISGTGSIHFTQLFIAGTVTTNTSFFIAEGLTVNGSFIASAGTATFTGTSTISGIANLFNITINGTSLQLAANATLGIANVMTITAGTLNTTSSRPNTVNFNSTANQNINAVAYDNLILSNGNSKTALAGITVNSNLTISSGTTFLPGTFTHSIYKNWYNYGSFTAGSSTVQFLGSATSTITGVTAFNILTINCSTADGENILQNSVSAAIVNMINGTLITKTDTITITNTRTGNGKILGNIRRNHSYTTGVAYAFKGPYNTLTFSTVSGVNSITVSVKETGSSDFPFGSSVSEDYAVSIPAGTYNTTLSLDYEDDELNGNNESTMVLWKYNGSAWAAAGKTSNSTTLNYVALAGLTSVSNRWTLASATSLVQWNGSVSSDWNNAANWTAAQGAPSMPPSALDVVDIGTIAFTNQPTISSGAFAKNIYFGSTKPVVLTLASGGTFTVSGNMGGNWNSNATHTINANNQNLVINGDLNLSNGIMGQAINLNIGTGSVSIGGSLTESGGANIQFSSTGVLSIYDDFHYVNGAFSAGNGTVLYNGTENQTMANVTYNNLTINKTAGLAAANNDVNILGNLLIAAGELDNFSTATISGNLTISAGATLNNSGILKVGGNWANTGSFIGNGLNVIFNGSGTQTISATTFNNFTVKKPVGSAAILTGNIVLNGDLTVISGTLDVQSFDCNRSVQGGTITLGDSSTFIVGANNSPLNFSNGSIADSSTVIADGTGPQAIFGLNFGNLILRNAGIKTLISPININGNLTIENGAEFNGGSQILTLNGHWINNGTFTPSTGSVLCNGLSKNISGNTVFNEVTIFGSYTILNDVTFNKLLNITSSGSLSGGATIHTTLHGDLINSGVLYTLGTTTFSGNVLQTLSLINAVTTVAITVNFNGTISPVLNSTSVPQYGFLNINNTGGVHPSVGWTILYALSVSNGALFNAGSPTHNILGSLTNNGTITSSGRINFTPSAAATINFGTGFSSTGTVVLGGAGAITLAGSPDSLNNLTISNTNAAGITPSSDWNLARTLTINSGSIMNGGSRSYLVGGNFSNAGTLNSGTSMFTFNGSGKQDINTVSSFNNLTLNNATGPVSLLSDATVNGILNFVAGNIQTGNHYLIQPATGTVTGAAANTGWVNGNLQKNIITGATAKTFEVGDSTNYSPVSVVFSNVTTAGPLTAFTAGSDAPNISSSIINSQKSVNRYWSLTGSAINFTTYNATFRYPATNLDAGASSALFGVSLYAGSSWLLPVTTAATDTSATATDMTLLGNFSIGEICNRNTVFTYALSSYCSSSGTASVSLTGTPGGVYSSSAGLSLNPSTGSVDLAASVPGTYVVLYNLVATGECPAYFTSSSISIQTAAMATGSYTGSPYCAAAGIAYPTGSSNADGIFSSTAGMIVDSLTGGIDLAASTPGTYTLTYTIPASRGCSPFLLTAEVTILPLPSALISYNGSPYHADAVTALVSLTGTTGGTFSSTNGLDIDSLTGSVDLWESVLGTYTVTYTVTAGSGCDPYQTTTHLTIIPFSNADTIHKIDLGTAGNFVLLTANGAVANTGVSNITGSIGTNIGAITGFEASTIAGVMHIANSTTAQASMDLLSLYTQLDTISPTSIHAAVLGSGETLNAGVYAINAAGSVLGTLTLDAKGVPGALFIFKIQGAFSTGVSTNINLVNGASACNVFWLAEGAIAMAASTTMRGTVISNNGAVSMAAGGILDGRMFSTTGAIAVDAVLASIPGCYSASDFWTGAINTRWDIAGNWARNIVPVRNTNVTIPTGLINYPLLNADTGSAQNITIQTNASITVTGSTLKISGAIINSGTFDVSGGKVEMNGSSPQAIPANVFAGNHIMDLTINDTAGVTLDSTLFLTAILSVQAGQFHTGGHLTLVSTAAQTALIDGSGAGDVLGNVTTQRYLASAFGYKYISSPFESAIVNQLADDLDLHAAFPSFYTYDENLLTTGWVNYTDSSRMLIPGHGYAANFGSSSAPRTIDITGVVNNNTINIPTLYNHNRPYTKGFNLVGNPYPSPVDWDSPDGWERKYLDDAVYYFNASTTDMYLGNYSSYINGISSDGIASNIIPAMQGFFVHVTDGDFPVTSQFAVRNNARTTNLTPVFHSFSGQLLRISAGFADVEPASDAAVLYFDDGARKEFGKEFDALKLMNTNPAVPNLYTISSDSAKISIRAMAYPRDSITIQPLGLNMEKDGWVTFHARSIQNISQNLYIYLFDAGNNTYHDLRLNPRYRLLLPAGDHDNRFSIVFSLRAMDAAAARVETFTVYSTRGQLFINCTLPPGEKRNLAVSNMLGQIIYRQQVTGGNNQQVGNNFTSGIYIVSLYSTDGVQSKKVLIER